MHSSQMAKTALCTREMEGDPHSMQTLTTPDYIQVVSKRLLLKAVQVRAAVKLLDEGNTIPFIARYRKEMTGELDENELRDIAVQYEAEKTLFERKSDVLRLLAEQGMMDDEQTASQLTAGVAAATTLTEVDDIYRPYRPKRKTRASVAKERGLGPLADWLMHANRQTAEAVVRAQAGEFVVAGSETATIEAALEGACDIIAEAIADDAASRRYIRATTSRRGTIRSRAVDAAVESVYELYYDYQEPLVKVPPHRVLAMNRGEREGVLKVTVEAPTDEVLVYVYKKHATSDVRSQGAFLVLMLEATAQDAYKRLLAPTIEREVRSELTDKAEEQAIHIFGENLRNLLLQPPMRGKAVLGVDPAYRTGCKLAAVDDTGKLLEVTVIYPTPPLSKVEQATATVRQWLDKHQIELIAIGNGTASRETESFIADCVRTYSASTGRVVPYVIVSEAGASVYSASPLAGEEFPDLDVAERSAISIARRLQDPLAELVKIDPKAVGVGQYQHDVSQKRLGGQLGAVVESAVNQVGVDVNTASPSLLSYVAGLNKTAARNIVEFREQTGRFKSRKALSKVPRIGPKTLEQCVGFLRILNGDEVLDATPIHPESYTVVAKLLTYTQQSAAVLGDSQLRHAWIYELRQAGLEALSPAVGVGIPTLRDILEALERPGRDVRDDVPAPLLRTDVLKLEDLSVGMELTGTVRNVVDFGAFVDVGLKNDGLVHLSQLADRYVKHPMDVVAVGDIVKVRVVQIDLQKHRLGLSMRGM